MSYCDLKTDRLFHYGLKWPYVEWISSVSEGILVLVAIMDSRQSKSDSRESTSLYAVNYVNLQCVRM